jgi:hypothetical protein
MAIGNPDFLVFSGLSKRIEATYAAGGPDPWKGSPFQWISEAQSGRKGAVGKKLVKAWAEHEGLNVKGKSGRGHAFRVDSVRVAVKLSLIWADGIFVFEQIREENFDVMSLLAVEPRRVRLWIVPKDVLWNNADWQHRGTAGRDTKWLHVPATKPPAWLNSYGGTLRDTRRALEQARDDLSI